MTKLRAGNLDMGANPAMIDALYSCLATLNSGTQALSTPANTVLLFDLGGVLIKNEMFAGLKRLLGTDQSEAQLIELWLRNPVVRRFELGQCSEASFSVSVVKALKLDLKPDEFLTEFRYWPKGFYEGVEPMLAQLRQTCTLACLSNANETHWPLVNTSYFDHSFASHLIGRIKPDRNAFEHVLTELGVQPSSVYFFDDAQANVEAARACGLNAYHTVGFGALKDRLQQLGFVD